MANEFRIQTSIYVRKSNLEYQSRPTSFQATMNVVKGPTPGAIAVTTVGTDIDLSELTTPGICRFHNLDLLNSVRIGRWDPVANRFYPFLRLKPGEFYVVRLSDDVEEEYVGTGSGTSGDPTTLRAKAENASLTLLVEAFND